jgi:hypothetical protein
MRVSRRTILRAYDFANRDEAEDVTRAETESCASQVGSQPAGDARSVRPFLDHIERRRHPATCWPHSVHRPQGRAATIAMSTLATTLIKQAAGSPQPISQVNPNATSIATAFGHDGNGRQMIRLSPLIIKLR